MRQPLPVLSASIFLLSLVLTAGGAASGPAAGVGPAARPARPGVAPRSRDPRRSCTPTSWSGWRPASERGGDSWRCGGACRPPPRYPRRRRGPACLPGVRSGGAGRGPRPDRPGASSSCPSATRTSSASRGGSPWRGSGARGHGRGGDDPGRPLDGAPHQAGDPPDARERAARSVTTGRGWRRRSWTRGWTTPTPPSGTAATRTPRSSGGATSATTTPTRWTATARDRLRGIVAGNPPNYFDWIGGRPPARRSTPSRWPRGPRAAAAVRRATRSTTPGLGRQPQERRSGQSHRRDQHEHGTRVTRRSCSPRGGGRAGIRPSATCSFRRRFSASGRRSFARAAPLPGRSGAVDVPSHGRARGRPRRALLRERSDTVHRSRAHTADPRALSDSAPLSDGQGSVLDPIVAIRRSHHARSRRPPPRSILSPALGETRDACLTLVEKYRDRRLADRVFDLA